MGAAATKAICGDIQTGASTAASGTKNNYLNHEQYPKMLEELSKCKTEEEKAAVKAKWKKISEEQDLEWQEENEVTIVENKEKDIQFIR